MPLLNKTKKPTWPKAIACSEGLVKLGRQQCLVWNINLEPTAWGKEQVSLVTEGGQIWLQEIVTMYKLSLPFSRLQAVSHSSLSNKAYLRMLLQFLTHPWILLAQTLQCDRFGIHLYCCKSSTSTPTFIADSSCTSVLPNRISNMRAMI